MGVRTAGHLLLADWISRREDAVIDRASFPNEAGSLALRPRDKSDNFAHIRSSCSFARETIQCQMMIIISFSIWDIDPNFEVHRR
jgi:hypothetical protein